MRPRIVTKFDICTGCRICEMICSFTKEGGFNANYARLMVRPTSDGLFNHPVVCIQCDNPACLRVCPVQVISRDPETGVITLDTDKCNNCGLCVRSCSIGMILLNPGTGKPMKCDLCVGSSPQCVEFCPTGALILVEIPEAG